MSSKLYSIIYISRMNFDGNEAKIKDEVNDIIKTSTSKNTQKDVTGALLFSGGYFIQVLEGPLKAVESIFESIQNDFRHKEISTLSNAQIDERSFPKWSMALAGVRLDIAPEIEGLLADPDKIETYESGQEVIKLLSGLLERYEEC